MTVVINTYSTTETSAVDTQSAISATEAQRRCNRWLLDNIKQPFRADEPEWVESEWRIPVVYVLEDVGIVGRVGHIQMNSQSGEITTSKREIDGMLGEGEKLHVQMETGKRINISAREARRECNCWLDEHVAATFLAQEPELIDDDERMVWRVPVVLTATHVGVVGEVGRVDVDVMTAEIFATKKQIKALRKNGKKLYKTVPPYTPRPLPREFMPPPRLQAPVAEPVTFHTVLTVQARSISARILNILSQIKQK